MRDADTSVAAGYSATAAAAAATVVVVVVSSPSLSLCCRLYGVHTGTVEGGGTSAAAPSSRSPTVPVSLALRLRNRYAQQVSCVFIFMLTFTCF